jgi:putative membrane protein
MDMPRTKIIKGLLGASAVVALFAALAAQAQSTSQGGSTDKQGTSVQSNTASGTGMAAPLARSDRKIVMNLAQLNMTEVEAGKLAQSKSQNEQVKNFAKQMIDDHGKALSEVQQLAQAKGVTLPTELDRAHKAKVDKLAALSGEAFDHAYLAKAGVDDHRKAHAMLNSAKSRAKDPELKALAARILPTVDQHLNSATQLHSQATKDSKTGKSDSATQKSGD